MYVLQSNLKVGLVHSRWEGISLDGLMYFSRWPDVTQNRETGHPSCQIIDSISRVEVPTSSATAFCLLSREKPLLLSEIWTSEDTAPAHIIPPDTWPTWLY